MDEVEPLRPASADAYSPQRRTALVLTGTGTAGAYHAGVLRALHEAAVKIDVVAGHGIGVLGALFAAIDGAESLWNEKGFWRGPAVGSLYPWRLMLRATTWALALSVGLVAVPITAVAIGLLVYPIDFVAKMMGLGGTNDLIGAYLRFLHAAFAPQVLPTWLPRLVVLVLGLVGVLALATGWMRVAPRRHQGPFWWRVVRSPLSAAAASDRCWRVMWDRVRGAAQLKQPPAVELARRYTEMLGENLGQPGFRELLLAVHDLDAHRDLIVALVEESRRSALMRRPTSEAAEERRAELFDLAGVARDYLVDFIGAAFAVPLVTDAHPLRFAPDGYWRGETHRLCDRPASLARIIEELAALGTEQILIVSAAPETRGPHTLARPRLDGRGRIGEYLQSTEAAVVRDAAGTAAARRIRMFSIRPAHNPIGPFDFSGGFDDRSDRRQRLDELLGRGYEDAYHQFIEPVWGKSDVRP